MNVCLQCFLVCTNESILLDTPATTKIKDMEVSLTAVGLALNLLKVVVYFYFLMPHNYANE